MDLLRSCVTNACEITGLSTVKYHVFSARLQENGAAANGTGQTQSSPAKYNGASEELRQAEQHCRGEGIVCALVEGAAELWLFEVGARAGQIAELVAERQDEGQGEIQLNNGQTMQWIRTDSFSSSAANTQSGLSTPVKTPASAPPAGKLEHAQKESPSDQPTIDGTKPLDSSSSSIFPRVDSPGVAPSDSEPKDTTSKAYELFLSAVVSNSSYQLMISTKLVPLSNGRLIESRADDPQALASDSRARASRLVSILAYLTVRGTLMVWLSPIDGSPLNRISCVVSLPTLQRSNLKQGETPVLVSPGSLGAIFHAFEPPARRPRKSGTGSSDSLRQRWKLDVADWLGAQGIHLQRLQPEPEWVYLQAFGSVGNRLNRAIEPQHDRPFIFSWPACLCFVNASANSQDDDDEGRGKEWLANVKQEASIDPLAFCESWFSKKGEREALMAARKEQLRAERAKAEAEEASKASQQQANGYSQVPQNLFRLGGGADLQAAGAIYPTPPDGPLPQNQSTSGENGADFSTPQESNQGNIRPEEREKGENDSGTTANRGTNDDMILNDLEDDLFDEPGESDPDFSFFDEPGMNDMKDTQEHITTTEQLVGMQADDKATDPVETTQTQPKAQEEKTSVSEVEKNTTLSPVSDPVNDPTPATAPETPGFQDGIFKYPIIPQRKEDSTLTFGSVAFDEKVKSLAEKYSDLGRFWFDGHEKRKLQSPIQSGRKSGFSLPRIGFPTEHPDDEFEPTSSSDSDDDTSPRDNDSSMSDVEDGISDVSLNESSPHDPMEGIEGSLGQPVSGSRKRKRESPESSLPDGLDVTQLEDLFSATTSNSALPLHPGGYQYTLELSDEEYVEVSQILIDQARSPLPHPISDTLTPTNIADSIRHIFPDAQLADFDTLASLEEGTSDPTTDLQRPSAARTKQPTPRPSPRTGGGWHSGNDTTPQPHFLAQIPAPHIALQRGESPIAVRATALRLWEDFGLSPYGGSKDVSTLCLYPDMPGLKDNVGYYLDCLAGAYENLRLGVHRRARVGGYVDGLVPIDLGESHHRDVPDAMRAIDALSRELGNLLADFVPPPPNIVVYMINPFTHPRAVVDLCTAFLHIRSQLEGTSVILKITPLSTIAPPSKTLIPTKSECASSALEIYDRLARASYDDPDADARARVPSCILSAPPPRSIDFRLVADPPLSVLNENAYIHVSYACSADGRWVVAAWSDGQGNLRHSTAYSLRRRRVGAGRPLAEVIREVWETSVDLVRSRRARCRVAVAKVGSIDGEEVTAWQSAASNTPPAIANLFLLSLDTDALELRYCGIPDLPTLPTSTTTTTTTHPTSVPALQQSTPVSTPQPSINSPEQSANNPPTPATPAGTPNPNPNPNPSTPAKDAEGHPPGETSLDDPADDTWGIILAHRLRRDRTVPMLASGVLIRRGTTTHPTNLMVHLVHTPHKASSLTTRPSPLAATPQQQLQKQHDLILGDLLVKYRALAALSEDGARLPWHAMKAKQAMQALEGLL